jgi:hypothetical protein
MLNSEASRDDFARELFEDAKCSLRAATIEIDVGIQQRNLRHALFTAFSFLELQIDIVASHFTDNSFFSVHERGVLSQRDVVFDRGVFKIKNTTKYSRLTDRMFLLQNKFKGSQLSSRAWWAQLIEATDRRNAIAHPRSAFSLDLEEVERDLACIIQCADDIYKVVFGKGLPYAVFGTKPKSVG